MSLLDLVGQETAVEVEGTTEKVAGQSYGARQRAKQIEAAQKVKEYLEEKGVDLEPIKEQMDILLRVKKEAAAKGPKGTAQKPVLYKLFGDAPKVGDTVTAADMFARTFKGFQEMRQLMKKWAAKGIDVEYISEDKVFKLNTAVTPWDNGDNAEQA